MATTVSDDTKELKTSSSSSPSSSVTSQGENVTKFGGGGESLPEFLYDEKIASLEDRIRSVTGAQRNTEGDNGEKGEEDFDFSDFDPTDSISSKVRQLFQITFLLLSKKWESVIYSSKLNAISSPCLEEFSRRYCFS